MRYPRLQEAMTWAVMGHAAEEREGADPLPYVFHPFEVVAAVRHIGGVTDEKLLCAAALHDLVEQGATTLEKILEHFGPETAAWVKELTRRFPSTSELTNLTRDEVWELKSQRMLEEIRQMSPGAQCIKLADRWSNFREARRVKPPKKLARYARQTAEILRIIDRRVNPGLWDKVNEELTDALDRKKG